MSEFAWTACACWTRVTAITQRTYGSEFEASGPYLISLSCDVLPVAGARFISTVPQARGVMDDFGDLRLTRGWQ